MASQESNNGLYFIVGALLVAVVGLGMLYYTKGDTNDAPNIIEKTERTIERVVEPDDSGSSFNLEIDEDGVKANVDNDNDN